MMTPLQQKDFEKSCRQTKALYERALAMTDDMRIQASMHNQPLAKQISEARHRIASSLSVIFNAATIAAIKPKEEAGKVL